MPTLGEVCSRLRVSRRTLDKWLERLKIEPQRHAYDLRFFTITDEQVTEIQKARAKMPSVVAPFYRPASLPPLATHHPSEDVRADTPKPSDSALNANPVQQRVQRARPGEKKPLPDGCIEVPEDCVPVSDFGRNHGIWRKNGRSLLNGRAAPCERPPDGFTFARWSAGSNRWYTGIMNIYTPEQQAQATDYAREHWPDEWHD